MTKVKKKFQPLECKNICQIYKLLLKKGLISFPITEDSINKTEALVKNINDDSFGIPHYKTPEEKSVAYLYFIIKNHPFTDGNKRTASLSFEVVCELNDLKPDYKILPSESCAKPD